MLQKKSSLSGMLSGLVFIPLSLALLIVFSCTEENNGENGAARQTDEPKKQVVTPDDPQASGTVNDKQTFVVVEDMPTFRGKNVAGFREYIQQQIEYPEEAAEEGIEGTVFVKFVVNNKGENTDVEVIRGVHETLDQAAAEAIRNAPDWEPGKQRGKAVKVQLTIPVVFKL